MIYCILLGVAVLAQSRSLNGSLHYDGRHVLFWLHHYLSGFSVDGHYRKLLRNKGTKSTNMRS